MLSVNLLRANDAYMRRYTKPPLVQIMAYRKVWTHLLPVFLLCLRSDNNNYPPRLTVARPSDRGPWTLATSQLVPRGVSSVVHYDDVIMTMLASQITSLTVVYSIVYSGVNQRKHQSSASLAFVREIHRGPVNFPHKWPVTRKMFPFDDVIMTWHWQRRNW